LLQRGFELVADDQVLVETGMARAPVSLAGLIEVRGLGIIRMAYLAETPLLLVVQLGIARERLPVPAAHAALGLPMVTIDPATPSAPDRLIMALDCAAGRVQNVAGAFTA
jgi:HPr kinase/phosphorylase